MSSVLANKFMQRCLDLAKRGVQNVSPNPMVGSVVVFDGKIIGEGFHKRYGDAHAEVNAINSVQKQDLLQKSTLFVNLEPCSHTGKTPPCASLILEKRIPKVIVGMKDPNPLVAGKGIELLKRNGVQVEIGILEAECRHLNRSFIHSILHRRPYYIAKWAQTADNMMARPEGSDEDRQISRKLAQIWVHKLRSEVDGIMIGINTANTDNPALNNRYWTGSSPLRIIVDPNAKIKKDLKIFSDGIPTLIFSDKDEKKNHVEFVRLQNSIPVLEQIDRKLMESDIARVLVEGGRNTLEELGKSNRMDELYTIQNQRIKWGDGVQAPSILSKVNNHIILGSDIISQYLNPILE